MRRLIMGLVMTLSQVSARPIASPRIPDRLRPLERIARNFAWAWVPGLSELFEPLDGLKQDGPLALLWKSTNLEALAENREYVKALREGSERLDAYLSHSGKHAKFNGLVAYFCAEYGLHESLPIYSGGLGILAGDHCKEASDLSLPFVAVGLLYRRGFFRQAIDHEGRQEHEQPILDPRYIPLDRVLVGDQTLTIEVPLPGRVLKIAVWRAAVGKANLLLLDTDLPENAPEDRPITAQLYTSGRDMRLHQEIVLGVGGVRALQALGIQPTVWHLNEGHSAFLLLERLRRGEPEAQVRSSSILTIHTPVPAGNERFDIDHACRTLEPLLQGSKIDLRKLGRDSVNDPSVFDMTAFALRLTRSANGVSILHGRTADKTWRKVAKHPIIAVTNGVHMPTWVGPDIRSMCENAGATLDPETDLGVAGRQPWIGAASISSDQLWDAHLAQKRRMVEFARQRLREQHARHGAGPNELDELVRSLNPDALIIGFARRFATYKRASLLFSNPRRLARLLGDPKRPVQILFAGKAHPADREGQKLIGKVYQQTQRQRWRGKVFLLENYDMEAGRMLVQGVDLWLNNPRRPLEASGTSGMKAAANGVPNASILDGWWDEAYDSKDRNGFAIGSRKSESDEHRQDEVDAEALYGALEEQILPTFFDRREEWIRTMKRSIASSIGPFSTTRMSDDYVQTMYGEA